MRRALFAVTLVGCGGAPHYGHSVPAALSPAPAPVKDVRLEVSPLPWWTNAGSPERFILGFPAPDATTSARDLGAIRSTDVELDLEMYEALQCAWMIVPMGDPRPCAAGSREEAMGHVHQTIHRAFDDLRTRTGVAGANLAAEVRCYATKQPLRLWCEGRARVASEQPRMAGPEPDPVEPRSGNPPLATTRFALTADASVAVQGNFPVVGSSIGFRYRPIETTFDILDLTRDGTDRGLVGVGLTALGRYPLGRTGGDVIVGASAAGVAPNGATNPQFSGRFAAFTGVAYQTSWRWMGAAQPWVQLRVGAARYDGTITPVVGLHLGLSTPDR
jgi:hypothetical protein